MQGYSPYPFSIDFSFLMSILTPPTLLIVGGAGVFVIGFRDWVVFGVFLEEEGRVLEGKEETEGVSSSSPMTNGDD